MRLLDILTVERVTLELGARDKASALRALARVLAVGAGEGVEAEAIARVFEEREALASTGVGSGVAIPHGRMAGIDRLRAAVAIAPGGVEFDAIDGLPATILVAILGPERASGEHLKALARFSRLLRRDDVRARLIAATDREAAFAIIASADA